MRVERVSLPGAATIVVVAEQRTIFIEWSLSRDQAALVIAGVLPDTHPDAVDHWLDRAYPRRRLPFGARQMGALGIAALIAVAFTVAPAAQGHPVRGRKPPPVTLVVHNAGAHG